MSLTYEYKDYCSSCASTPTTCALDGIGARLAQELLGRILIFIDYSGTKEKRDVGQLALTCRYWATKCQPAIFKRIWLRSGKEVDELLSLMASPLSRVSSYIKTLVLIQKQPSNAPWIHLVALRLVPKLSLDTEDPIDLSLSNVDGIRSIHDGLPRSYPSFSSHISQLHLKNAHFNSFADLLHLADEMPSLQNLECSGLTWPTAPDTPPVVPRQRGIPPHLRFVSMDACTDNSALVCVLTGRRRQARANTTASLNFGLHPEQQHTIHKLVCTCAEKDDPYSTSLEKVDSAYNMILVSLIRRGSLRRFYFILPSTTLAGPNSIMQVEIMAMFIENYETGESDKWNQTCEHLPHLQKLVLGFSSREDMTRFVREVAAQSWTT
ncbi:hypothetical protein PHLCEN_2v4260 [Hermanssonia centrifuga]|uniref:F-box domain-containing protein n=1 Tax=Hermanssonia centrifuga TaxID=98765 RepID=A0A2R6PVJ1_9APHY|nr:hypothetical protein PHLCEN_2v4260 [Hermanssonia centrifuga]